MKNLNRNDLFNEYRALFSSAQVSGLEETGLDIIEAGGQGPFVYDIDGRKYLDCYTSAGVYNLGRRPPEVVDFFKQAIHETDQGNFPMISIEKSSLARSLAEFVPGGLECSVFSVSRGEAIEFACKLARGFTGRRELISLSGSWLGQTGFAMSLSQRQDKSLFEPLVPDTKMIPNLERETIEKYVTSETAAVIIELVQAENHCYMPDAAAVQNLHNHCRNKGVLLIFDETQTGMGRTGRKWAFDYFNVEPDILIIGEAVGAGVFPIAATMYSQRLNKFMNDHPLIHLSTFGGSDLGCRVAEKAVEVYARMKPWENAAALGESLKKRLREIEDDFEIIKSVRGIGFLWSIELPGPNEARRFCRYLSQSGVLAAPGEVALNTVVLRPALTLEEPEVDDLLSAIRHAAGSSKTAEQPKNRIKDKAVNNESSFSG